MKVFVAVLVTVVSTVAHARPDERLVFVGSDEAFTAALDDALVPAGMEVVAAEELAAPSTSELTAVSRRLADREQAAATVWLLPAPDGTTLVTYDRDVDRVLVRELPYRSPLTATQATEAARMVRTMLRALRLPAEAEPRPKPFEPAIAPRPPPTVAPWLGVNAGVAAWFLAPGDDAAIAGVVAIAWRPHGLGAGVSASFAPAAALRTAAFAGDVRDLVLAATVHGSLEIAPAIRVRPAAGLALHALGVEGSFGGEDLESRRYDPAGRVAITGTYALPRGLDVGLAVSADCLLRRPRYAAGTEEILLVPRVQVTVAAIVGLRL